MKSESLSLHLPCARFSYNLQASENDVFAFQTLRKHGYPRKAAMVSLLFIIKLKNIVGVKKCKFDKVVNYKGVPYNLILDKGGQKIYSESQGLCNKLQKQNGLKESEQNFLIFQRVQKFETITHKKMKSFSTMQDEDERKYGLMQIPSVENRLAKIFKITETLKQKFDEQHQFIFKRQKFMELANELYNRRQQNKKVSTNVINKFKDLLDQNKLFPDLTNNPLLNNVKVTHFFTKQELQNLSKYNSCSPKRNNSKQLLQNFNSFNVNLRVLNNENNQQLEQQQFQKVIYLQMYIIQNQIKDDLQNEVLDKFFYKKQISQFSETCSPDNTKIDILKKQRINYIEYILTCNNYMLRKIQNKIEEFSPRCETFCDGSTTTKNCSAKPKEVDSLFKTKSKFRSKNSSYSILQSVNTQNQQKSSFRFSQMLPISIKNYEL